MKKTQLALAALALAASSAAMADGVTLYGNLEGGLTSGNNGSSTRFSGAGEWGTTLWGIKGEEDLGGGLKASFNLQGGLETNSGAVNNGGSTLGLFNRLAYVAVGSSVGTVGLGHQFSPFIGSFVSTLALAGNNFLVPVCAAASACDGGGVNQGETGGFFIPNSVTYSGSFGALSTSLLASTKNGDTENKNLIGNVSFTQDNLYVTAAYSKRDNTYRNMLVGGTYAMGDLKLAANYIDHSDESGAGADSKTYTLGASYALGATTVGVNYSKTNVDGGDNPSLANLSVLHSLSKRTGIYAFVAKGTNGHLVSYQGTTGDATRSIGVGVTHAF